MITSKLPAAPISSCAVFNIKSPGFLAGVKDTCGAGGTEGGRMVRS